MPLFTAGLPAILSIHLSNSVVDILGGWKDGGRRRKGGADTAGSGVAEGDEFRIGEVLMYGFPGFAFEVLKCGVISAL